MWRVLIHLLAADSHVTHELITHQTHTFLLMDSLYLSLPPPLLPLLPLPPSDLFVLFSFLF